MRYHCGLAKVQAEDFTLHALRQISIFVTQAMRALAADSGIFHNTSNNPRNSKNTFIDTALVGVN